MTASGDQPAVPDVDRLARSMLLLHGGHEDDRPIRRSESSGTCSKAPDFADDPQRTAAIREATRADRERYLRSGLQPVDCRFCHATVSVKKQGPGYTAVQWNTEALQHCAYFAEVRARGGDSARTKSCPKLTDSIEHAVTEGYLDFPPTDE
jgi:hypothetical protein